MPINTEKARGGAPSLQYRTTVTLDERSVKALEFLKCFAPGGINFSKAVREMLVERAQDLGWEELRR